MLKEIFKRINSVKYTEVEETGASYWIEKSGQILRIYFQGSNSKADWMNNFDFVPVERFNIKELFIAIFNRIKFIWLFITSLFGKNEAPTGSYKDMESKWYCHRGFLRVWKSVEPYVKDAIMDPDIVHIEVAGYSHGAALAVLCHEYCMFNRPDAGHTGYGFGCPRVVWGPLPIAVRKRFENFQVIRNCKDLVTHVPPVIFGFRHVGTMVKVGSKSVNCIKDHFIEAYEKGLDEYESTNK